MKLIFKWVTLQTRHRGYAGRPEHGVMETRWGFTWRPGTLQRPPGPWKAGIEVCGRGLHGTWRPFYWWRANAWWHRTTPLLDMVLWLAEFKGTPDCALDKLAAPAMRLLEPICTARPAWYTVDTNLADARLRRRFGVPDYR